jgi:hypothetical protein
MLALQRQVAATWVATFEHDSVLCRDHGLELDIEPVGVELAFALVAVRVLDHEVFAGSHGSAYERQRGGCDEGRVVDGMTLMRNVEIHVPDVLDPGVDRALSVPVLRLGQALPFRGQFRLFPSWRQFDELPREVRETKKTATHSIASYREFVAGKLIVDSLLDTVRFFYACDPSIAAVTDDGELLHFPLPTLLPVDGDRHHPLESLATESPDCG